MEPPSPIQALGVNPFPSSPSSPSSPSNPSSPSSTVLLYFINQQEVRC